ncbi:hypothetical protein ccbrp13_29640 [Ktedonobacteria bacterium brp13]|nr:hypothetical protein ccbrp13_29640 [Ktedonobacteria bacterium brp13]
MARVAGHPYVSIIHKNNAIAKNIAKIPATIEDEFDANIAITAIVYSISSVSKEHYH